MYKRRNRLLSQKPLMVEEQTQMQCQDLKRVLVGYSFAFTGRVEILLRLQSASS